VTSGKRVLSLAWDPQEHPRVPGHHKGGGEFTKAARALSEATGRSPTSFVHPSTGHVMYGAESGDTFEELLRTKGASIIRKHFGPQNPMVRISGAKGAGVSGGMGARNTPLDFRLDNKYGGELKTLHSEGKNMRIAMKTEERDRKVAEAAKHGWTPVIIVQVVDPKTNTVHLYAHEGTFESKRVRYMNYIGSYNYSQSDFRKAQQATGHWDKRTARLEAQRAGSGGSTRAATRAARRTARSG